MIGLIRTAIRLAWLVVIVLGIKRLMEIAQGGADTLAQRIESGDADGLAASFQRVHDALHRGQAHRAPGTDPFGEM